MLRTYLYLFIKEDSNNPNKRINQIIKNIRKKKIKPKDAKRINEREKKKKIKEIKKKILARRKKLEKEYNQEEKQRKKDAKLKLVIFKFK